MAPAHFRLKALREAAGLTQAALAARVGVRQATINDIENGHSRQDTLALIDKLCQALDCEPGELIVREPKRRRGD
ncbi:MAG TPA: helix-turn-helix transcriptional regulator [Gemmatimonadales bacterium]|nr:helix-turn-helix transcriptional regulator [Gemmatimonadales bacterium]HRZ10385.1 helix-turn-helix transcriptional regulator [Gemmatimonadales bacterium]